jgi:hypothetical protein
MRWEKDSGRRFQKNLRKLAFAGAEDRFHSSRLSSIGDCSRWHSHCSLAFLGVAPFTFVQFLPISNKS